MLPPSPPPPPPPERNPGLYLPWRLLRSEAVVAIPPGHGVIFSTFDINMVSIIIGKEREVPVAVAIILITEAI